MYRQYLSKHMVVSLAMLISVVIFIFSILFSRIAVAVEDDDEYEQAEDVVNHDVENDRKYVAVVDQTPVVTTEKITVSETVSKEITTTTQSDVDGDGVFDDKDEYPNINNYFIVKDDNRNGIVDTYEK